MTGMLVRNLKDELEKGKLHYSNTVKNVAPDLDNLDYITGRIYRRNPL